MKHLSQSIISAIVSAASAGYAWFAAHGNTVATVIAIAAGIYSIRASRATIRKMRQ